MRKPEVEEMNENEDGTEKGKAERDRDRKVADG